ncbi:MAG: class I SAM-dependent methyltransferase [Acidimicrobiia bacterium]
MEDIQAAETALITRYRDYYARTDHDVLRELERRTLGSDCGGNGYTDVGQAAHFVELLGVGTGDRLLELGSGAGWPGLYLSEISDASVVISDIAWEGLAWGSRRARTDGLAAHGVACSGTTLPFRDRTFQGVTHSDVLC